MKEKQMMNLTKSLAIMATATVLLTTPVLMKAEETHKHDAQTAEKAVEKKAKPYPLDKCIVSDEKLGEHGKPYVFTHEGQEIKLCCKVALVYRR